MTRKKGIALIICLTLIISMALPGTMAVSTDQAGTNDNVTFTSGNDQTPPSAPEGQQQGQQEEQHEPENPIRPENPTEGEQACTECGKTGTHAETCSRYVAPAEPEKTCTCGSTDGTHAETCSQYVAPAEPEKTCTCGNTDGTHAETCSQYVAPAEPEKTCTCNPQPGEGEPHRAGCAFYTSVMGTTAAAEEPTTEEATVDITYVAVGPVGAASFGSVAPESEKVMAESGTAGGSTPTPGTGFKFVGWFKDQICTLPVDAAWIENNKIIPQKTTEAYEAATYYAKFDYAVADLTIKQDGGNADENQTFIYVVTGGDLPESGIKVAVKGNSSVTIRNLKIGSYTVTEGTNWNWRCGTTGGSQSITLQGAQTNEVSFTNNGSNFKWLSGNAYSVL